MSDALRASEVLGPALLALISAARDAAARVAATARIGRAADGARELDAEAVHDMRVALRRLRTLLRPARRVYGKKRVRALEGELRAFADATGALRDEEVLRETLASLDLPARVARAVALWSAGRGRQERALRAGVVRLLAANEGDASQSLDVALDHLEAHLLSGEAKNKRAHRIAEAAIGDAAQGVRELAGGDPRDAGAMHALRIRWKRLRYTAELFGPMLGVADALVKAAARMQKRLGELHDLDEAMARVGRARGLSEKTRGRVRRALAEARIEARARVAKDLAEALQELPDEVVTG